MITFRKITKNNYEQIIELNGGKKSEEHCAPNYRTILDAVFQNNTETLKAIYLNDKPIGVLYYYIFNNAYWINRLLILMKIIKKKDMELLLLRNF